jgi:hypothetical protein|tara:strand:+ start:833 stop:1063 length:231 start_codon:yes stop_codon:yes gene_type:complete
MNIADKQAEIGRLKKENEKLKLLLGELNVGLQEHLTVLMEHLIEAIDISGSRRQWRDSENLDIPIKLRERMQEDKE